MCSGDRGRWHWLIPCTLILRREMVQGSVQLFNVQNAQPCGAVSDGCLEPCMHPSAAVPAVVLGPVCCSMPYPLQAVLAGTCTVRKQHSHHPCADCRPLPDSWQSETHFPMLGQRRPQVLMLHGRCSSAEHAFPSLRHHAASPSACTAGLGVLPHLPLPVLPAWASCLISL